jgi:hypothetical protein
MERTLPLAYWIGVLSVLKRPEAYDFAMTLVRALPNGLALTEITLEG